MYLAALIISTLFGVNAQVSSANGPTTNSSNVPVLITEDGKLTHEAFHFTTRAYEREALRLVIEEANKAAKELQLPEILPITQTNLTGIFIVRYGMTFLPPGMIGSVHTRDYGYFVSVGHKLSYVEGAHQTEDCMKWREDFKWSVDRINTNQAYQLAVQWMSAASMDVKALNRDFQVRVEPDPFWNSDLLKQGHFVPIYDVYWMPRQTTSGHSGDVAFVCLFAPTKTLISLRVEESQYILRKPLEFNNLDSLLSQTNASDQRRAE